MYVSLACAIPGTEKSPTITKLKIGKRGETLDEGVDSAGGKGTWGKAGDEYKDSPAHLNKGDPNYDPEAEE